jgi:hypothetical protein
MMAMNEAKAKEMVDYVFKDVFGRENPFTMGEFRRRFAFGIDLPGRVKDSLTGADTWLVSKGGGKVISADTAFERAKKGRWMSPQRQIRSMEDIKKYWKDINYMIGEKNLGSIEVAESDLTYSSSKVYRSYRTWQSQDIAFSNAISHSRYLVASFDNAACTSGIRMFHCTFCSSGFAINWSKKVSKSMFVNGCTDLHECLFCSNIASKRYCVANMQFAKERYLEIKNTVVDWVVENFGKGRGQDLLTV